jgi:hypothetical protein
MSSSVLGAGGAMFSGTWVNERGGTMVLEQWNDEISGR